MNGTTTCSYLASIHLEGTKVLVDVIRGLGQRAFVGKVWRYQAACPERCSSVMHVVAPFDACRDKSTLNHVGVVPSIVYVTYVTGEHGPELPGIFV